MKLSTVVMLDMGLVFEITVLLSCYFLKTHGVLLLSTGYHHGLSVCFAFHVPEGTACFFEVLITFPLAAQSEFHICCIACL